jgi:two-component system, cell cycle sensor histidine kinase and response regulator CckA
MGMNPTILIVDDDDALVHSVRRLLERAGYEVLEASTVAEARTLLGESAPDLLIMDLVLPGLQGREGANLILAQSPGLPVIFMSGYTSQESIRMGQIGSADPFLRKPFSSEELLGAVERALAPRDEGGLGGA